MSDEILDFVYKKIPKNNLEIYIKFYKNNKILSNWIDQIFAEEKDDVKNLIKNQIEQ